MIDLTKDEGLVEAVAAQACEPDANWQFCTTHQTASGEWPCPVGPRAVIAAVVEHLRLKEETERGSRDEYGWMPEHWVHEDEITHSRTRLTTPWREIEL